MPSIRAGEAPLAQEQSFYSSFSERIWLYFSLTCGSLASNSGSSQVRFFTTLLWPMWLRYESKAIFRSNTLRMAQTAPPQISNSGKMAASSAPHILYTRTSVPKAAAVSRTGLIRSISQRAMEPIHAQMLECTRSASVRVFLLWFGLSYFLQMSLSSLLFAADFFG